MLSGMEHLVLRTANDSLVEPAEIIGLEALKPPTDFCQCVLDMFLTFTKD